MRMCGAALLAITVLATPTSAETFIPFHGGVNLSVAPGGAESSSLPVATLQAENARRVTEAAEIGFDFVRLPSHWPLGRTQARRRISRRR
jgi:hypothetical protein